MYRAKDGNSVVYSGVGAGPKGSYILIMKTTSEDAAAHDNEYEKWFESLKVF